MADNSLSSRIDDKYQVNLTNCNFQTLVIGDKNTVNVSCRRLEYPEQSTASRSGGIRRTAIGDGGELRGTKRKQTKIRFPQRKYRPDPKLRSNRGSSESEDEIPRYNSLELFPTVSGDSDRMFEKSMNKFHAILNRLHPLRDRGDWSDFNSVADSILQANKSDLELEILISIEKSVVVSYQNDLERAEVMVLQALKTLAKAKVEMNNFLVTMAHCHLTGFYRRLNKHGKAENSITTAEQNSRNFNSRYVKALIYYEMASNLTKYISSIPLDRSARDELVERGKNYMKQCIDLCVELDDGSVYIKKHHFGLIKLALLDLNCRTKAARAQITSSRCIEEAKNCLRTVAENYENEMSEGQKIQFFVARSDLNYRHDDLQAAQSDASHALSLAETHGFRLEVSAIKEKQDDISSKLMPSREAMTSETLVTEEYMESLSSSTSPSQKNSPYSSGRDME